MLAKEYGLSLKPHKTVRAAALAGPLGTLYSQVGSREQLRTDIRLPDDLPKNPEKLIGIDTYLDVIDRCTYLADDPDFMLCNGIDLPIQTLGLRGQAMLSANSLWDALLTAQASMQYFQIGSDFNISISKGRCRVWYNHGFEDSGAAAKEIQYTMGMIANLVSQARHQIDPDMIVCYPRAKSSHMKRLPAATNVIDNTEGTINLDARALRSSMPLRNSVRSEILKRLFNTSTIDIAINSSVTDTVTQLIRASIDVTRPSQPLIAAIMGTTVRALQRSLHAEQTTFRKVLEHSRLEIALNDLQEGKGVTATAMKLGYDHPQNFATAFQSWYGTAPSSV